jgi:hypothetical protein
VMNMLPCMVLPAVLIMAAYNCIERMQLFARNFRARRNNSLQRTGENSGLGAGYVILKS